MNENLPTESKYQTFKRYYRNLEPLVFKSQNRVYTAAIFSFFAISLFGWFAIRPTIKTILTLRREISDKTEINRQMESKIADLISAQSVYQSIENQLFLLDEAMPKNPEAVETVLQMRNLVGTSDATIASLMVGNSIPLEVNSKSIISKNGDELVFNSNLLGSYIALEEIMSKVNNMRRIVNIEQLSIEKSEEDSNLTDLNNLLQMNIQLRSFFNP